MIKITPPEYNLMKKFIEEQCGIHLENDKQYLIESRLNDLLEETGAKSFQEFHFIARMDYSGKLKDRIVDAMTTNETSWFRDKGIWEYIEEVAVQELINQANKTGKARIWSAAASTGQEAYSLIMALNESLAIRANPSILNKIEIIGTDISSSALFTAISGRYDSIAMARGLSQDKKNKYFKQEGNTWVFDQKLKSRVSFKKFNLQNSFASLGIFDLVLCRYVSIYFSDGFKKELFRKLGNSLKYKGVLLLGATESLRELSNDFEITVYKGAIVNIKK